MTCNWKGCEAPLYAAGLCSRHYNRLLTRGTCEDGPRARRSFSERLWSKIDKRGPDECWLWTAKSKIAGYGALNRGGRGTSHVLAHRAVWEETHGPIAKPKGLHHGLVVMHTCDERLCCNPAHLRLGTQGDNVKDMDTKRRRKTVVAAGSKRSTAKHTEEQITAFKRDKDGTIRERAERHGVTIGVAKQVLYAKRWSHLK